MLGEVVWGGVSDRYVVDEDGGVFWVEIVYGDIGGFVVGVVLVVVVEGVVIELNIG